MAAAISYWEDAIGLDVDKSIERNRQKEQQEVVKEWLSNDRIYGLLSDRTSGAIRENKSPMLVNRQKNKWAMKRRRP